MNCLRALKVCPGMVIPGAPKALMDRRYKVSNKRIINPQGPRSDRKYPYAHSTAQIKLKLRNGSQTVVASENGFLSGANGRYIKFKLQYFIRANECFYKTDLLNFLCFFVIFMWIFLQLGIELLVFLVQVCVDLQFTVFI